MADLQLDDVRLHFQRLGDPARPSVVFVHGLIMDNLASWYFTVANAVASSNDVILYDLRGHGLSEDTGRPEAREAQGKRPWEQANRRTGIHSKSIFRRDRGPRDARAFARGYPHPLETRLLLRGRGLCLRLIGPDVVGDPIHR